MGAKGSSYKSMHFLEVTCYIDELAQSFGLHGHTCFLSKNFLNIDPVYSLGWEQTVITSDSHAFFCP